MSDLVERLRNPLHGTELRTEAADEIERLHAWQRARLEQQDQMQTEIDRQRSQLIKAQEALSPFAAISLWRDLYPDAKGDFPTDRRMQGIINPDHVRAARAASPQPDDHQSAQVVQATHNSGEGEPVVTQAYAGADTCSGEEAIKSAANEAAPGAQIVRRDGDFHIYYAGFNLSKFVRFLALTSAQGTSE